MRQQPLRLAVAAARAAGRRLALIGGPERRSAPGSGDRLRFRAGSRSTRRSWPRSRARAGFESSSGIPPLGGFEGDGGGHGPLPPPSSESESDCPGDGPRRPSTIGTNITARTSPRYTSPRMLTPPICGALGMVQSLPPDRSAERLTDPPRRAQLFRASLYRMPRLAGLRRQAREYLFEGRERIAIERVTCGPTHDLQHLVGAKRRSVRPVRAERLCHIGDGEDPRRLIELRGHQPAVVPAPVQPLVVSAGDPSDVLERAYPREYLHRPLGMATDRLPLSGTERTGLVQNPVRYAELPDVVQQRPATQSRARSDRRGPAGRPAHPRSRPPLRSGSRCRATWRRRSRRTHGPRDRAGLRQRRARARAARPPSRWQSRATARTAHRVPGRGARRPARDRTTFDAACALSRTRRPSPPCCQNTSAVWARHSTRPASEISSPEIPAG